MDWSGRAPAILLSRRLTSALVIAVSLAAGCDSVQELLDPAEIEAQLRDEPGRGGKVGQLVGIHVLTHAARMTDEIVRAPDARCSLDLAPGSRWVAEFSLERRRGDTIVSSWTETRTLDRSEHAVAMRLSATFDTEIGGRGSRDTEWRVTEGGTFLSTAARDGDLWMRRDGEEDELDRVLGLADGMLQALLDSVDGWGFADGRWVAGNQPLRCSRHDEGPSFVDRFVASAKTREASLDVADGVRTLHATWQLADGSSVVAKYSDHIAPFLGEITAPPADRITQVAPDRSLARAQELLTKLAADGLAEVASNPPATPEAPKSAP